MLVKIMETEEEAKQLSKILLNQEDLPAFWYRQSDHEGLVLGIYEEDIPMGMAYGVIKEDIHKSMSSLIVFYIKIIIIYLIDVLNYCSLLENIIKNYEKVTGMFGWLSLSIIKKILKDNEVKEVKMAIERAINAKRLKMNYITQALSMYHINILKCM